MSAKTLAKKQHSASIAVNESETTTSKQNHHDLQANEHARMNHLASIEDKINKQTHANQLAPVDSKKSSS